MSYYYPTLNEKDLKLISKLMKDNPDYLTHPDCPYSETTKILLGGPTDLDHLVSDINDDFDVESFKDPEYLLSQVVQIYNRLEASGQEMRNSESASDKTAYFRLSTSLMEKLISMQERVYNMSEIKYFKEKILQIMEEEISTDDRSNIIERIKKEV